MNSVANCVIYLCFIKHNVANMRERPVYAAEMGKPTRPSLRSTRMPNPQPKMAPFRFLPEAFDLLGRSSLQLTASKRKEGRRGVREVGGEVGGDVGVEERLLLALSRVLLCEREVTFPPPLPAWASSGPVCVESGG